MFCQILEIPTKAKLSKQKWKQIKRNIPKKNLKFPGLRQVSRK